MKILRITHLYPHYINYFYKKNGHLKTATYNQQLDAFYYDHFSCGDGFKKAFNIHGIGYDDIFLNIKHLQKRWALEHGLKNRSTEAVAIAQIKHFKPNVLWFDYYNADLLRTIRCEFPDIRLIMGYSGSALSLNKTLALLDMVISCAPETVELLRAKGAKAEHLHHAFNPEIIKRIKSEKNNFSEKNDITFIGQLIPKDRFHVLRIKILEELCRHLNLVIYSPERDRNLTEKMRSVCEQNVFLLIKLALMFGVPRSMLEKIPHAQKIFEMYYAYPCRSYLKQLKKNLKGGVFGIDMFEIIQNSKITLNIHADSSPTHASNMRLFEIAGMGSCLLTDWKTNMDELFIDGKECITFKTPGEALEKAKWLLTHPEERRSISQAGQERVLKEHTYERRVSQLIAIIKKYFINF